MSTMTASITTEDLANNIKGLGPQKASLIKNYLDDDDNEVSVASLANLRGVSRALAHRVVSYVEAYTETHAPEPVDGDEGFDWDGEHPEPTAPEAVSVASNGHTHTAGEVRRFAREAESFGYSDVAEELRTTVRALLDNEPADL